MNSRMVIKVLGYILTIIAICMILPFIVAILSRQRDAYAFLITIIITLTFAQIMSRVTVHRKGITIKEGLIIVTGGWLLSSIFGALPFVFSGSIPSVVDALFETISGFSTTGATILADIEIMPNGILFWRSFTHWLGGMGILVVAVAVLPIIGSGGFHIFKAESPGPVADKIAPRIRDTAKILYITYIAISLLEFVLLMFGGMSPLESAIHTFGTLGTGGFSTRNASIGAYNNHYIFVVIGIFMLLSGTKFSLFYEMFRGRFKETFRDSELRLYLAIIGGAVIALTISNYGTVFANFFESLSHSFFQVVSITTTTGYGTYDYEQWSSFSQAVIYILMFVGGSAGSTGGSVKVIRILILMKFIRREFTKILHPRAVYSIKVSGISVADDTLLNVVGFFVLYLMIFVIGTLLISLEGIGFIGASSSVAATLGNIGPGFGFVGPTQNYAGFSDWSKLLLSFFMLLGRLELFTVIVLLTPTFWKK